MKKTPDPNGFISKLYKELKKNNNFSHTQNFSKYENLSNF